MAGTLLELGLVGTIGWVWLLGRTVRQLSRRAREDTSPDGWLFVALAASVTAFAVGMLTFDAFSFVQVTFALFILLGLGARHCSSALEKRRCRAALRCDSQACAHALRAEQV